MPQLGFVLEILKFFNMQRTSHSYSSLKNLAYLYHYNHMKSFEDLHVWRCHGIHPHTCIISSDFVIHNLKDIKAFSIHFSKYFKVIMQCDVIVMILYKFIWNEKISLKQTLLFGTTFEVEQIWSYKDCICISTSTKPANFRAI